ncbi:hypothetical protein O0L34_g5339 [Tuta absoluta]|nr:hypothetical protein O0L34_g5339 [Tuta absoluta]
MGTGNKYLLHYRNTRSLLPGTAQWETMMRRFSQAQKETCRSVPEELPKTARSLKTFPTGSTYVGSWDPLGMSGQGTYTFPQKGVVYKGGFSDGTFHGDGELSYECGAVIKGKWNRGRLIERKLVFADGLEYDEEEWDFCRPADRRFTIEHVNGLLPADITYKTADQPTRQIPPGFYDIGYGFYDPITKSIYKYDDPTSIHSCTEKRMASWIESNCRKNPDLPVGPCPFLYEKWAEPTELLDPDMTPVFHCASPEKNRESRGSVTSVFSTDSKQSEQMQRPKGKLFESRSKLYVKTGFYDPRFLLVSEMDFSKSKNDKQYEEVEDAEKMHQKTGSSVAFNLREPEMANEMTKIQAVAQEYYNTRSLTRAEGHGAQENADSIKSITKLQNVYDQSSENVYSKRKIRWIMLGYINEIQNQNFRGPNCKSKIQRPFEEPTNNTSYRR